MVEGRDGQRWRGASEPVRSGRSNNKIQLSHISGSAVRLETHDFPWHIPLCDFAGTTSRF